MFEKEKNEQHIKVIIHFGGKQHQNEHISLNLMHCQVKIDNFFLQKEELRSKILDLTFLLLFPQLIV